MAKPYRLATLGLFAAFGVSLVSIFQEQSATDSLAPPSLLPAAYANPGSVSHHDTLQAGETLSQLLARAELAQEEAREVLAEMLEYQDPRRLHPGSVISYRRAYDSGEVSEVALRLDSDRTLSMQRAAGGWLGRVEEVPVRTETAVLSGTVRSSLYAALLDGEGSVPPAEREMVADLLADQIFAWQIDFSRDLRVGDRFRIVYERAVRPDGTARSGRVTAVQFNVAGRDYEAYAFELPDGTDDYYDGEGESLRRAFLKAPLKFRRISSAFSTSRFHPVLKRSRPHWGTDYAAAAGTPIHAVGDGVVRLAGRSGGYGNLIEIRHNRGYSTRYGHLRGFATGIRTGVRVQQGDVIGYVGSTGLATGPHLHYEFHEGGRPVNPNTIEQISGDPVPEAHEPGFMNTVETFVRVMDEASGAVLTGLGVSN
jgi:murein DD-endopeptidase MepM/ murein hydrolase activator NlpD